MINLFILLVSFTSIGDPQHTIGKKMVLTTDNQKMSGVSEAKELSILSWLQIFLCTTSVLVAICSFLHLLGSSSVPTSVPLMQTGEAGVQHPLLYHIQHRRTNWCTRFLYSSSSYLRVSAGHMTWLRKSKIQTGLLAQ